jgi:hypothetical protein
VTSPKPEQLVEFYDVLGSNYLKIRDGYTIATAGSTFQTSHDLAETPIADDSHEVDFGHTVDLRGFTQVQWLARCWQPGNAGLTGHLHYSVDGTTWHDFGEPDVPLDADVSLSEFAGIPFAAIPVAKLGLSLNHGDGSTPVDATIIVSFR